MIQKKLWIRVMIPVSIVVLLVLLGFSSLNIIDQEKQINIMMENQNIMLSESIESSAFDSLAIGNNDEVRRQLSELNKKLPDVKIYIYDFNNTIAFSTEKSSEGKRLKTFQTNKSDKIVTQMLRTGLKPKSSFDQAIGNSTFNTIVKPILNEKRCFHCHGTTKKVLGGISVLSSKDNAISAINSVRIKNIFLSLISVGIIILLIYGMFVFLVNRRIGRILSFAGKLRDGDFSSSIDVKDSDEISEISNILNLISKDLREIFVEIQNGSNLLSTSSKKLTGISTKLDNNVNDSSAKTISVSAAAEQMSTNMNSVAAAMEESTMNIHDVADASKKMNSTVFEIKKNSSNAQNIIKDAVQECSKLSQVVTQLGKAASDIDDVTDGIRDISNQVNLLALNATIEASRAGEAGLGFAVVANEIKTLANQTAHSTNLADEKLRWMQKNAAETALEIDQISQVIDDANLSINTIASAVDEQSATSEEITVNINNAFDGLNEVNESAAHGAQAATEVANDISSVNRVNEGVKLNGHDVNISANELLNLSEDLQNLIERFKV
jgi:methyl-accepting chemotaxis protein